MAFPCNQFAAEEPGTPTEIAEFVSKFGVTFPIMEKVEVNGEGACEVFKYLNGGKDITWNFAKYLVDKQGKVVGEYDPEFHPDDIVKDI